MSGTAPAAVPDAHGGTLWRADPTMAQLLRQHLPGPLLAHLEPHLDRLGESRDGSPSFGGGVNRSAAWL